MIQIISFDVQVVEVSAGQFARVGVSRRNVWAEFALLDPAGYEQYKKSEKSSSDVRGDEFD